MLETEDERTGEKRKREKDDAIFDHYYPMFNTLYLQRALLGNGD